MSSERSMFYKRSLVQLYDSLDVVVQHVVMSSPVNAIIPAYPSFYYYFFRKNNSRKSD